MDPLLMVWNLQEVAVKPFAFFYIEILMSVEASGGWCESIIDGLEIPGSCFQAIHTLLQRTITVFGFLGGCREAIYKLFQRQINNLFKGVGAR